MKNWKILETIKDDITPESLIDVLLKNRGITPQERQAFLKPEINSLTLDSVGIDTKQVAKATKRIIQAIDKKEHIVVYGDYDVDGIT